MQLLDCDLGVLHGQGGDADEAVGTLRDLSGQYVVRLASELGRSLALGYPLDGRRIQRRDHDLDAGFVHQPQALVLKVQKTMPQLGPHVAAERLRVSEGGLDREMILERDLSLHVPFPGRR